MQAGDEAKRRPGPNDEQVAELLEQVGKRRISRREVLRRGVALGLTIPAIGWLLAACGRRRRRDELHRDDPGGGARPRPPQPAPPAHQELRKAGQADVAGYRKHP